MKACQKLIMLALLVSGVAATAGTALAAYGRHYYGNWGYHNTNTYYYRQYYYKPTPTYDTYNYHYCIYYPSQPNYVYYYNPYSKVYWGRFDIKSQGYSLLADKDRKAKLKDIPESAFPKAGEMPAIPESSDGEKIPKIAAEDLPNLQDAKDAPSNK